ncbi:hypothetical protein OTK49_21215 [Vibrio coralliirubri]|uniref:hypothetical protein n=1 Tax=Vibrio coralliirubri TaxID=1516159 RepID=UPI0022843466|nr:hypothetical protein [Vibrio coralliirubri]MCY9865041.1 hypothetical protein [Vibrio coralliirubri]
MSTLKLRANQLSNMIGQITTEADTLAQLLKSGITPKAIADELEEVLAHSLILVSTIADTLIVGNPPAIIEMSQVAKDFLANLKDINQTIQANAIH